MPLSKSVLRKYTPPTCTLEIKGKESVLSRWAGRTALQDLNFKLSFDDPRQPDEQQVTVWGDRSQLEALNDAVETYIQNFLEQPPAKDLIAGKSDAVVDTPPSAKRVNGKTNAPATPSPADNEEEAKAQSTSQMPSISPLLQPQQLSPYLEPAGLVSHKLFLGSLQTRESGPSVNLSALQLFDLAQALEEYGTEMVALPSPSGDRASKFPKVPLWGYATAAGVLLAVGLATQIQPIMKLVNSSNSSQSTAQAPESTSTAQSPAPLAGDTLPEETAANPTTTVPGTSSLEPTIPGGLYASSLPGTGSTLPTGPGAISSFPTNPGAASPFPNNLGGPSGFPTNPGAVAQLPPNLRRTPANSNSPRGRTPFPNPATGNGSDLFASPGVTFQVPPAPGNRQFSVDPKRSLASRPRTSSQPSRNRRPSTAAKTRANPNIARRDSLPNVTVAPDVYTPESIFAPSNSFPLNRQATSSEQPKKSRNSARSQRQVARNSKPTGQTSTPTEPPSTPTALESPLTASAPPLNLPAIDEQEAALPPNLRPISPATPIPQSVPSPVSPSASALEVPKTSSDGAAQLTPPSGGSFTLTSPNSPTGDTAYNPSQERGRLFDRIPQVTEARDYFQQQWKPPTDLPQSKLEYTLVINSNGSVERIIPLTSAAGNYIGQTGMPKPGSEQVVSPLQGEDNAKIRVVLYKDGNVETFLEP